MSEFDSKQTETTELVPQTEANVSQTTSETDEKEKLSTIRNILLGGQIKQYDSRFTELEQRFEKIKEDLFDQLKNTLSGLEKKISTEFETLTKQITDMVAQEFGTYTQKLDDEKKERYTSIEKFVSRLDQLETVAQSQFNDLKNQVKGIESILQQKISDQVGIMKADLQTEFDTLSTNMHEKIKQQTQKKIERTELASFFKDMADRFSI
jgi:F0F1-type ATP synthase membrane subunit b/b'